MQTNLAANGTNLLDMTGAVALVTGAGQGVGRQIALHLASHGAAVAVNDYFPERAEAVAAEIESLGHTSVAAPADVTSFEATEQMTAGVIDRFGALDVLVNNAGNFGAVPPDPSSVFRPFWESTPEDWDPTLAVNLGGVLNCTRHALAAMVPAGRGSIVTVVSEAGRYGDRNMQAYAGAKAGAAGVMRSVARDGARHGVRANCVAIAATRTPATEAAFADEALLKSTLRAYPLGRIGEPEDAANAVLFLASEAARHITGQVYGVNGGFLFGL